LSIALPLSFSKLISLFHGTVHYQSSTPRTSLEAEALGVSDDLPCGGTPLRGACTVGLLSWSPPGDSETAEG
jgi:hypothetical protein